MTETNSQINEIELKRYLYGEMSDEERERMEETFFLDDELFVEAVNLENELVDLYARGKMTGEELARFERSLEKTPERRAKVANAVALQTFIAEERPGDEPISEPRLSFWQKLAEFFTVKTPALGFAMTGLLVLLTLSSVLLYFDNRRKSDALARLQNQQQNEFLQRQAELESQLADSRQRENDLKSQIDAERESSGDLTDELESERRRREQLERELERLRKESVIVRPTPAQSVATTFASIFPSVGTRGGQLTVSRIELKPDAKRLLMRLLDLPETVKKGDRVTVKLDGRVIAQDLAARAARDGKTSVQLTLLMQDLPDGVHDLTVHNAAGAEIGKYRINVVRK